MYYITIFVEEFLLNCFIGQLKGQEIIILTSQTFNKDEQSIADLTLYIKKNLPQVEIKPICRCILMDHRTKKASLALPNIPLLPFEIDDYVKQSLAKIFINQESLAYDFIIEDKRQTVEGNQQIIVYAYPSKQIDGLIKLFPWQVIFLGIPNQFINESAVLKFDVNALATMKQIDGINLLPWRNWQRKARRKQFFYVCFSLLIVITSVSIILYYLALQALNQQIHRNTQLQDLYLKSKSQLTQLIDINKQNNQLKAILTQRQSITNNYAHLIESLMSLSETIPNNLWLNSLEYYDDHLNINGVSYLYDDILLFSLQLEQHNLIMKSEITTIKKHYEQLLFNIKIQLDHAQNSRGLDYE